MPFDYIIQSKISEQQFEKIVYQWLIEGDFTPDDITHNISTENNRLLMPLYLYRNTYSGSCSASIGNNKMVPVSFYDFNAGKMVTGSTCVTEWQAHTQPTNGTTATTVYAGSPMDNSMPYFAEGMYWTASELISITKDHPHYNRLVTLFKISKSDCWSNKGRKKADDEARQQTKSKLPSQLVNNLILSIDFTEIHFHRLLAPFWLFNYEYEGETYYVMVDGNNPSRISGTKPEDKKIKNTIKTLEWLGWLMGLSIIISTLYFFADNSFESIEISWPNIAIVVAGIYLTWGIVELSVRFVKHRSKEARKRLLGHRLNIKQPNSIKTLPL